MSKLPNNHDDVAPFYDLHAPKNVEQMLDFFEFACSRHAHRPIRDVLELGIGTGRFAIPLAQRGYRLTGTDGSAEMLRLCQEKATSLNLSMHLRQEWFQDLHDQEQFDSVVAIFTAIGFLVDDEPIRQCIRACLNATRPGGFVLLDVPNGLQGLIQPWSGCRVQHFEANGMKMERFLNLIPDTLHGIARYRDTGLILSESGEVKTYQEEYRLRIFSLPMLKLLLEPIPFQSMTCYCNWTDREPLQAPYERLIVVLEK